MKKLTALLLALAMAFLFAMPAFADAGEPESVRMNVRVADGSHYALPVDYIFSLESAARVANATIVFELDGTMLEGGDLTFLAAGFSAMDGGSGTIAWTQKENGIWQGRLLVMYLGNPDGFTAALETDIFKLSYRAKQMGITTLRVTEIRIAGFNEAGEPVFLAGGPGGEATTEIALPAQLYSVYDLNKDGVIDERDLAMAQRYYMVAVGDASWTAAQACDFNGDRIVNMLDLIDLFRNFGIAVAPDVPPGAIEMGSLSALNLTMGASSTITVAATASNGQAVQLTALSEDTGVATVAVNGADITVTAVAVGSATISVTASAPNCLDVVRRFTVTVTEYNPASDIAYTAEEGRRGVVAAVEQDGVRVLHGTGSDVYFRLSEDLSEFHFAEVIASADGYYAEAKRAERQTDGTWLFTSEPERTAVLGSFVGEKSEIIGSILPDALFEDGYVVVTQRIAD